MTTSPTRTRRWTRAEYERLIAIGVFRAGEPVELVVGDLIVSEPQGTAHYTAIGLVEGALRAALGPEWLVRSQGPIALDDESEPEPDVAVTRGGRRDYSRQHPARPALVVEVADSSLGLDRGFVRLAIRIRRGVHRRDVRRAAGRAGSAHSRQRPAPVAARVRRRPREALRSDTESGRSRRCFEENARRASSRSADSHAGSSLKHFRGRHPAHPSVRASHWQQLCTL